MKEIEIKLDAITYFENIMRAHGFYITETHVRKIVLQPKADHHLIKARIQEDEHSQLQLVTYDDLSYTLLKKIWENTIRLHMIEVMDMFTLPQEETIEELLATEQTLTLHMIRMLDTDVESLRKQYSCSLTPEHMIEEHLQQKSTIARLIALLADQEHGSDWDPRWKITLRNEEPWLSASGYWLFMIEDGHLLIEAPDISYADWMHDDSRFWEPENLCFRIPLSQIASMQIDPQ